MTDTAPPHDPTDQPPRQVIPMHPGHADAATKQVGMLVFMGSWAMMFGGLFYGYLLLRFNSPVWIPKGTPSLPLVPAAANTLLVIGASVALIQARTAFLAKATVRFQRLVITAFTLGLLFLSFQALTWTTIWNAGLRTDGPYASMVYFLTGFHALHVVVGVGLLAWLLPTVVGREEMVRKLTRLRLVSMFWHMVGAIWLVIFALLYII